MNSIFVFIGTIITTAIITTILWELKFKNSKKKLLDKINSLQEGLNSKQEVLQKAEVKIISLNSHCNLLEAAVVKKDLAIAELNKKLELLSSSSKSCVDTPSAPSKVSASIKKYRGRPKKKQSSNGGSTSNNNKTEKNK